MSKIDVVELANSCGCEEIEVVDNNFESPEPKHTQYCFTLDALNSFADTVAQALLRVLIKGLDEYWVTTPEGKQAIAQTSGTEALDKLLEEHVVGYLPAYELDRLSSGHDARLRSAKFGASALDGDIPLYTRPERKELK